MVLEAIWTCHDLKGPKTMAREVGALKTCLDEVKASRGLIITAAPRMASPTDERIAIVDTLNWAPNEYGLSDTVLYCANY